MIQYFHKLTASLWGILLRACVLFACLHPALNRADGATPWGKDYFPNVPLIDHDGNEVRFFDDLIEGKIVAINFIYTSCRDTCPLETAQLTKVQEILGDRLGKDVFFYSITLDPENDTPEVLKAYREKFQARWTFLTGSLDDIWTLQKKLGLFLEEIRDGLNNHNVNMIIGNQETGRWMKRSPHENPYVLADQIGHWLDGWKRPSTLNTYGEAPQLRDISRGEQLFRTRCAVCHTITGIEAQNALGPDLLGVTQRRSMPWLLRWIRTPDQMLEEKDPIAMTLYERYKRLPMPNMRLNAQEAEDVIQHIAEVSGQTLGRSPDPDTLLPPPKAHQASASSSSHHNVVVTVKSARLRATHPAAKVNSAYLAITNPMPVPVTLTKVRSAAFGEIAMYQMTRTNGIPLRRSLETLTIPGNSMIELAPGKTHLICRERRQAIKEGQGIDMTLSFSNGKEQVVPFAVTNP